MLESPAVSPALPPGLEPTHGDFHEGQLFVAKWLITGVLDIDTIGPGRRADDLACMIAHLSTMQRMTAEQAASLTRLINLWLQVFDTGSIRPSCGFGLRASSCPCHRARTGAGSPTGKARPSG